MQVLLNLLPFFLFWGMQTEDQLPLQSALHSKVEVCSSLANLDLANTTIFDASYLEAGANVSTPDACFPFATVPTSLCRVQFYVNTTSISSVRLEAWLPDEWYGRFLGLGNGGLLGCVDYWNLVYGTSMHFASVGSDAGHYGGSGSVFLNQPEVLNDFAWRAIHIEAVVGKKIVEAYYGRPHKKAYYLGCSAGGRSGFRSALEFPEDFDGILAGAPAIDWNHLVSSSGMLTRYIGAPKAENSPHFIPWELWQVINAEMLQQCDALDGVVDGIITEPDACQFRPETIQCLGAEKRSTECLSKAQVQAVKKIFSPLYGTQGQLLFPGLDPGATKDAPSRDLFSGSFMFFAEDWYRFTVYNDSRHTFDSFGVADIDKVDAIDPGRISTWDGNLTAFRNRGGKLLSYHGRQDVLIPSGNSKRFYDLASRTMSMRSLDDFFRLFLIPGMGHCMGGPGAWQFGEHLGASNTVNDSVHNILLALTEWVENGVAPDVIVGADEKGVRRKHCRYPMRSVLDGRAWDCVDYR